MFDMKNLDQLKKLDENVHDTMKAFWAFDKEAFKAGAVDGLQKKIDGGCRRADYPVPILY